MEKQAAAFIQADAATFKDLVQRLTGSAHKLRPKATTPFKLQERRKQSLGDIDITRSSSGDTTMNGPVTPLGLGSESVGWERVRTASEEERAIAEKGFYFHASPAKKEEPPALLTLFPLTPRNQDH